MNQQSQDRASVNMSITQIIKRLRRPAQVRALLLPRFGKTRWTVWGGKVYEGQWVVDLREQRWREYWKEMEGRT